MTGCNFNAASTDAKSGGQQSQEFFVCGVLNRRRGYTNSQRAIVVANNFAARCSRNTRTWKVMEPSRSEYLITMAYLMSVAKTACFIISRISQAMIGEKSKPPMIGSMRRNGPSSGSVALTRKRIHGFE